MDTDVIGDFRNQDALQENAFVEELRPHDRTGSVIQEKGSTFV